MRGRAVLLLLLWPLVLCGGCAYTVEEHDLFFPRRVSTKYWRNQRPVDGVQIKPVEIHADGAALRGWLFTPPRVRRYMVHFYGTGEVAAADSVVVRLVYLARQLECEILVMDYRGYGFTAGSPTFKNIRADALRAHDFIAKRSSGRGVLVYGLSIGTVAAVHAAAQRRATGLILQAPPTSATEIIPVFRQMIPIPVRWFIRVKPSRRLVDLHPQPLELIARVTCPLLVVHGVADTIVPVRFGREMVAAAGSRSKRLLEVPGAGHDNLSLADRRTIRALKQFATSCDR